MHIHSPLLDELGNQSVKCLDWQLKSEFAFFNLPRLPPVVALNNLAVGCSTAEFFPLLLIDLFNCPIQWFSIGKQTTQVGSRLENLHFALLEHLFDVVFINVVVGHAFFCRQPWEYIPVFSKLSNYLHCNTVDTGLDSGWDSQTGICCVCVHTLCSDTVDLPFWQSRQSSFQLLWTICRLGWSWVRPLCCCCPAFKPACQQQTCHTEYWSTL